MSRANNSNFILPLRNACEKVLIVYMSASRYICKFVSILPVHANFMLRGGILQKSFATLHHATFHLASLNHEH